MALFRRCRRARRTAWVTFALVSTSLAVTLVLRAEPRPIRAAQAADERRIVEPGTPFARFENGPALQATPDQHVPRALPDAADIREAWKLPPAFGPAGPHGGMLPMDCFYDNGPPADVFGTPSTQLSREEEGATPIIWEFIAAAADDFVLEDPDPLAPNCQIMLVRMSVLFFGTGSDGASPVQTWTSLLPASEGGVYVNIYANSPTNDPIGAPNTDLSGDMGNTVASVFVPTTEITEMPVGDCLSLWQVDIPIPMDQEITVARNVRYWLSVVPRHPAPPQTGWALSEIPSGGPDVGFAAHRGFPSLGVPFWTEITGNQNDPDCGKQPPAGSLRELSFQIFGADVPPDRGACCNPTTGDCVNVDTPMDCTGMDEVFTPGVLCQFRDPPCGQGACCIPDGMGGGLCVTADSEMDCFMNGGFRFRIDQPCVTANCVPPPPNDDCVDRDLLNGSMVTVNYDTTGAETGPDSVMTNVGPIVQDIWYNYLVPCDGTVAIDTFGSDYDTAIAVYGPGAPGMCPNVGLCPVSDNSELAANDDVEPGDTSSLLTIPALAGECLKIRVGGKDVGLDVSGGPGVLNIVCIPAGSGACCDIDRVCEVVPDAMCIDPGDLFFPDQPCNVLTCPPPPPNDDCTDKIVLTGAPITVPFDTTGATTPMDSPTTFCGPIVQDVWFSYSAPCDGTVTISTDGSDYDTAVAVYDGAGVAPCPDPGLCPMSSPAGDMTESFCNDDQSLGETSSLVVVPSSSGDCLLIRVGGKDVGLNVSGGAGVLEIDCIEAGFGACCRIDRTCDIAMAADCMGPGEVFTDGQPCNVFTCPPAPDNDECDDKEIITPLGNTLTVPYDTTNATTGMMPVATSCATMSGDLVQDIWYGIVVPCDGVIEFSTFGSTYDTFIAVYGPTMDCTDEAACPPMAPELGCNDDVDMDSTWSFVSLPAMAGDCLTVRVGGKDVGINLSGGFGTLNMQCIPAGEGACCHVDRTCELLPELMCDAPGDTFTLGAGCTPITCPPPPDNDDCTDKALLTGTIVGLPFDTTYATMPPDAPTTTCGAIVQDVWFNCEADCTGEVTISTLGSAYDTAIAVYGPGAMGCPDTALCPMPAPDGDMTELVCSDDIGMMETASQVTISVMAGACYAIRVGGKDVGIGVSGGMGLLSIECVPMGEGACCHADNSCEQLLEIDCTMAGDTFFAGLPCSAVVCDQPPPVTCCVGDTNGDNVIDGGDIAGLIDAIIMPPEADTLKFCRANIDRDMDIDLDDLDAFSQMLLGDPTCPPPPPETECCAGDANGDGVIDGSDIATLVARLLSPPAANTLAFCRSNMDSDDDLDTDDVAAFVAALLAGAECPPAPITCCPGDINGDGFIDGQDKNLLIAAVVSPPAPDTVAFCRADVEMDGDIDLDDVNAFVQLVLDGGVCPQMPDACADAFEVECGDAILLDNTIAATAIDDPAFSCGAVGSGAGSLWLTFVAADTDVTISTCNTFDSTVDTLIAVYDGTCGSFTELACNDDACGLQSSVCVSGLSIGTTYYVQVATFSDFDRGEMLLEVACGVCP